MGSVIVSGARTPIAKFAGAYKDLPAVELGAVAMRGAIERAGIQADQIDYTIFGQVLQAGTGQITSRQAAVKAGIPKEVPAITVNKVCLSGSSAIAMADQMIRAGDADIVVLVIDAHRGLDQTLDPLFKHLPEVRRPIVAVLNKKEGLMVNQKLRQAWQAALDIEPIMKAVAGGRAEFYRMDASLAFVENKPWYVKQQPSWGWNEHNKDKAKRLLQEAGYKGEPVRFVTTQEYKWMYDFALVSKQQLEEVGFKIDLQVMDWATLSQRRFNSKEYDVFTTGMGAFYDPTHHIYLTASWPGWTTDEDILKLQAEMARETDPKKRMALWEQQTRQFYEKVPVIRYGDLFGLRAARNTVKGFNDKTERVRFYNVWLEK